MVKIATLWGFFDALFALLFNLSLRNVVPGRLYIVQRVWR